MEATKKNINTLAKEYPFIGKYSIEHELGCVQKNYKTERGFFNHLAKRNAEKEAVYTMPDIDRLEIKIEWKRSQTWGHNPHAEWRCWFKDGSFKMGKSSASGYGYDKHSTVVAAAFNAVANGMAWRKRNSRKKAPYGLRHCGKGADLGWTPYFEGGIGIDCYRSIAAYLGGKMESHSGRTWDCHYFTFK